MIYLDWNATTPMLQEVLKAMNWLKACETVSLAMPGQIGRLWPILRIAGKKNPSPLEIREALTRYALLDELLSIHKNPVIIIHRPKTAIKLPVGILRECYPIAGVIVAGVTKPMDMGGIHDTLHFKCGHSVTRKGTAVFVGENYYLYAEASIAPRLDAHFVEFFILSNFRRSGSDVQHAV